MTTASLVNIKEVQDFVRLIKRPEDLIEVRAPRARTRGDRVPLTQSGYFSDAATLAESIAQVVEAPAFYVTLNPPIPALLARSNNRIKVAGSGDTTADHEIQRRRWWPMDLDPIRPAKISSTDEEHAAAIALAYTIAEELGNEGIPPPVIMDSGNGAWLLWPIDEPTNDGGLLASVLTAMAMRFNTDAVKVDTSVFNASRIVKVAGTKVAKGDETADRRHRWAKLLSVPAELNIVTTDQLKALAVVPQSAVDAVAAKVAAPVSRSTAAKRATNGKLKPYDVAGFVSRFLGGGSPTDYHQRDGGIGKKWTPGACPFNPAHDDHSFWIIQYANGAVDAGCSHESCGWKWADLRAKYDPKKRYVKDDGKAMSALQRSAVKPGERVDITTGEVIPPAPGDEELDAGRDVSAGQDDDSLDEQKYTEAHNARQMVGRFGSGFRWHHERGMYLTYDAPSGRWAEDATGQVSRHAKAIATDTWNGLAEMGAMERKAALIHATRSETARGIAAMLTLARSEPGVTVRATELDADPWLLNVANGVVDLRTGQLRDHSPGLLLTRHAPVTYDPRATCPTFLAFLNRIMAGDDGLIGYLQRVHGLCLTGDISVQELFVYWGSGANGKSVLCDTFGGLLGDYAGLAPPSLLTMRSNDEHPTEIADLQGRRCVFGSETEEGARLRIQLVKRLTGDATLKGRYMRQDYFEFPRTFKLILATNNRPRITENTNAIWRRLRLVPFAVVIPEAERDPNLIAKLRTEWPGILGWAVRGCLDWQRSGMQTPAKVTEATAAYQTEQDVLADYLAARCVRGDDRVRVGRGELFTDYQSWAHQTGERNPLDRNALMDRVRRLDGVTEGQWRPVGITVPVRGFRGIGLAALGMNGGDE